MAKELMKPGRPRRRVRDFAHVPLRLATDARDGLREVAEGLNWTEIPSATDDPMKAAWRKVRAEVLEPLLPAARAPLDPNRRQTTGPGQGVSLLSRQLGPNDPPNEYESVTGFNVLSRNSTLRLGASDPQGSVPMRLNLILGPRPGPRAPAERRLAWALAHALGIVGLFVLPDRGWTRLKRCRQCSLWFVDQTKPRTGVFCGSRCRERYWNRPHRHEAHRSRLRAGQRQKGGPPRRVKTGEPRSALRGA